MHIDRGAAQAVGQRRDLVHPAAIVAIVVGIDRAAGPALAQERPLDIGERRLGHQDVDIVEETAARRRQIGENVGGALQQDEIDADRRQRLPDAAHLPTHVARMLLGEDALGREMTARRRRHASEEIALGELDGQSCQQPGAAPLADDEIPIHQIHQRKDAGILQGHRQAVRSGDHSGGMRAAGQRPAGRGGIMRWRGPAVPARRPWGRTLMAAIRHDGIEILQKAQAGLEDVHRLDRGLDSLGGVRRLTRIRRLARADRSRELVIGDRPGDERSEDARSHPIGQEGVAAIPVKNDEVGVEPVPMQPRVERDHDGRNAFTFKGWHFDRAPRPRLNSYSCWRPVQR